MFLTILLLSIIGAIILLDKQAVGEFGMSQPIIACPLIGLIWCWISATHSNVFYVGLILGVMLQLVWIGSLPLGSKEPLDNQSAGVIAITTYILAEKFSNNVTYEKIIFSNLLFAGIVSLVGQIFSQIHKKFNNHLFNRVNYFRNLQAVWKDVRYDDLETPATWSRDGANKNSLERLIIMTHFTGLVTAFLRSFILIGLFLVLYIAILPLIKFLPDFTISELLVFPLIIGIAGLAHLVVIRKQVLFSILGMVTGVLLWVLLTL